MAAIVLVTVENGEDDPITFNLNHFVSVKPKGKGAEISLVKMEKETPDGKKQVTGATTIFTTDSSRTVRARIDIAKDKANSLL